jgi:multiple sugar transport system substrate-binding protein
VTCNGARLRSTLGGTGLAITRRVEKELLPLAVEYAAYVNDPETQRGMYTLDGGQPGHRLAWLDEGCNALTNDFFTGTLTTLDEAFLRPRYAGYIHFQDEAGLLVHRWLEEGGDLDPVIERIDALYRETLTHA